MTTMIVRLRVRDFDRWRSVFDTMADARREAGIVSATVHRDVDDRGVVVTILRASSAAAARAWAGSDVLRAAMQQAGVEGVPDVEILDDLG